MFENGLGEFCRREALENNDFDRSGFDVGAEGLAGFPPDFALPDFGYGHYFEMY